MDLRAQTDTSSAAGGDAPEVLNKAASTVQNVLDSTDQVADRAAEKVKQVTGRIRTGQDKIAGAVQQATAAAGEWRDKAFALREKPEQWMESAAGAIRARPFQAVVIAFVAGWIYGKLR